MQKSKTFLQFEVNFLDGPIFRALVLFAIPVFVSNIFQQLYNTVDTMIVGNYLGICRWQRSDPVRRSSICWSVSRWASETGYPS